MGVFAIGLAVLDHEFAIQRTSRILLQAAVPISRFERHRTEPIPNSEALNRLQACLSREPSCSATAMECLPGCQSQKGGSQSPQHLYPQLRSSRQALSEPSSEQAPAPRRGGSYGDRTAASLTLVDVFTYDPLVLEHVMPRPPASQEDKPCHVEGVPHEGQEALAQPSSRRWKDSRIVAIPFASRTSIILRSYHQGFSHRCAILL